MNKSAGIPIVDFQSLSVEKSDEELKTEDIQQVAEVLHDIFSTVGFVYLTNTGMSFDLVNRIQGMSNDFFQQPDTVKADFHYSDNHGWIQLKQEGINPQRSAADLKECFNVTPEGLQAGRIPDGHGDLINPVRQLFAKCTILSHRILLAIAVGLKLENVQYLVGCHNTNTRPSNTVLRLLYYPPLPDVIENNQVRLGEHTDYGSLTLLFQDQQGGLEVHTRDGAWIEVTPVEHTVLVNLGDLMQRWTSDRLLSTPHRVLNPVNEDKRKSKRQSIAFFFHPDKDTIVSCLDGTDKYSPILEDDFLRSRLKPTYRY